MAMELGAIVLQTGKYLCGFLFFKATIFIKFRKNVDALNRGMKRLAELKIEINEELELAAKEGKLPTARVREWLKDVEEIQVGMNSLEEEITASEEHLRGCSLNCCMRYRLSKRAVGKLVAVKEAIDSCNFPAGLVVEVARGRAVEEIPVQAIVGQKAGSKELHQILHLVDDETVQVIGIWGMGGVGKTTLVKHLNNKLELSSPAQMFDIIIWVTVSKDLDVKMVQWQIAKRLNMLLTDGGSIQDRAIQLFARLKKERKFLLILDDVWEKIDLDELGIPHGEVHTGCKIVLTTRSLDVCRGMMTDQEIKVEVLSNEEAWTLFRHSAGSVVDLDGIGDLARAVARECSGLPLAIITVGKAMRGKTRIELWKHALGELRSSVPDIRGIEKEVFSPLKLSYDSLQGKNIKPCFLYCSLFPEDFSIEVTELVEYWVAEGLIDGQQNLEAASNKGIAFIENLKDSCLLEDGARHGTVKMHDVVRDVAIWIASSLEDNSKFYVRSGMGLSQLPEVSMRECTKRASFIHNKIRRLPDRFVGCSQLSTLLLQSNPLHEILEEFFIGFKELRVLNLSGTLLRSLPLSLTELQELRSLLLRDCPFLAQISPIGELGKLQLLDLSGTQINELPRGVGKLNRLKQLNLSRTHYLKIIHAGTISGLSSLEVLLMSSSAYKWDVKGMVDEGKSTVEELQSLEFLTVLHIRMDSFACFAISLAWLNRLTRFDMRIGPRSYHLDSMPTLNNERRVVLGGIHLSTEGSHQELLNDASALVINRCQGLDSICGSGLERTFNLACLKSLQLVRCDGLRSIIGLRYVRGSILPNLEELILKSLVNLDCIWAGPGPNVKCLSKLRTVSVDHCPLLDNLICYDLLTQLENLEEIEINNCDSMQEIIHVMDDKANEIKKAELFQRNPLPKLRALKLCNLRQLADICKEALPSPSLKHIQVSNCPCLPEDPLPALKTRTPLREVEELRIQRRRPFIPYPNGE